MSIKMVIMCDGCGRESQGGHPKDKPAHLLRGELWDGGWKNQGRMDLCPSCLEQYGEGTVDSAFDAVDVMVRNLERD